MADEKYSERKKAMHINLTGEQVDDYEVCRIYTGIMNDNDLIRYLLRQMAHQARGLPLFERSKNVDQ